MYAAIAGRRATRLLQSSYMESQKSNLLKPSAYFFAKIDSRCMDRMAEENMVMGCVSRGMARSTSKTYCGTWERLLKSSTTERVSTIVGISPVRRKYQKP